MPVSSIGSYITVGNQFVNHWTSVNATLGANPLTLPVGYAVANLTTDLTALQTAITAVTGAINSQTTAAGNRDLAKKALSPRIQQFRKGVMLYLSQTGFANSIPVTPTLTDAESRFLAPFDDMANLWATINGASGIAGFTPPLLLVGGYAVATLNTDITALRTLYRTFNNTDNQVSLIRQNRDVLLPPLKARFLQYRTAIIARFGASSAFALSLPTVTPKPGSTPPPVSLSGVWQAAGQASLVFALSSDPRVVNYDVRACFGSRYVGKDEQTVESSIDPDGGHYFTTYGLAVAGASVWFKVYVVTNEGNEAGSNAVKITRPL